METTQEKEILRGGQFLVKETKCEDVFTPEDFSEEQNMMKEAVMEFNDREIILVEQVLLVLLLEHTQELALCQLRYTVQNLKNKNTYLN